jgi:hypothetical protein
VDFPARALATSGTRPETGLGDARERPSHRAGHEQHRPTETQGLSVWGMGTHLRAGTRAAAAASAQGVCEGHATMVGETDGRRTRGEGGEEGSVHTW